MSIVIKSDREIATMRQAGRIAAEVLEILAARLKPGMKTKELDEIAEKEITARGAKPSFKGYHGFPASICVSINDEIVHGIPGKRVIEEGDIVSIDLGTIYEGFQGDCAITVGAGNISPIWKRGGLKSLVGEFTADKDTQDIFMTVEKDSTDPYLTGYVLSIVSSPKSGKIPRD